VKADLTNNQFKFQWKFDTHGILEKLEQKMKAKGDFKITAKYEHGKTKITGKDENGKIGQEIQGLVLLKAVITRGN
jgi:hypothetical protein